MLMSVLLALDAESYEILCGVITQSALWLHVMDLEVFHVFARLGTLAISLQDLAAELAMSFGIELQSRPFRSYSSQSVTFTSSRSCVLFGFRRPMTSRVREGNKASWFPICKLTPARSSM